MADTFEILRGLVARSTCKPGWAFRLRTENGALRLVISVEGPDASTVKPGPDLWVPSSEADDRHILTVSHFFPVPAATYNEPTWRRWIFERCRGVENHELGEWFRVDGERPFAPLHGPGEDPYLVHEFRPDVDRRTRQDGVVRES